jgi:hypothetical protein
MDRAEASRIAHRRHPITAPITPGNPRGLLAWLSPSAGYRGVLGFATPMLHHG